MEAKRFAVKVRVFALVFVLIVMGYLFFLAFTSPDFHLLELRFNPFALLSAFTVITNLVLFFFFISNVARTEERMWLTLYLLILATFGATEFMQRLSATPAAALFWSNLSSVAVFGAPAVYLFTLAYTNRTERRYVGTSAVLLLGGMFMLFFEIGTSLIFIPSTHFATNAPWGIDFSSANGPAVIVAWLWYNILMLLALSRLISFRRHTRNAILRRQSLLFMVAISLVVIGGTFTDLLLPIMGIKVPPLAVTLGTPAAFMFIYGLVRYQLLTVSPTLFSNTILSIMQEAVVATDETFNIIFANGQAEQLLGVKGESRGRALLTDSITHQSQATFQKVFESAGTQSGMVNIEHIDIQRGHSEPVPVRVTGSRLKLSNYNTWVIVLTDISKELQTQRIIEHEVMVRTEELHRAQTYLLASINSLEQGFVLVDRNSKVELANGVAATMFGVPAAETSEKHMVELVKHIQWNVDLADMVHKVLDTKRHRTHEAETADGSYYQIYVTPIISGEHVLGATVVIQNITEQKILDRSKDEFFSIASHELRTPLTAIRGNMSMVKDYFPEAMKDESLSAMINDTHNASVRLIEIVSDFLDSSKLEQGKMVFDIKPVAIKPLIDAVQGDLKILLENAKDTVTVKDIDNLPKVAADEARVRQILYNLLSNAIKYNEGGAITVSGAVEDHNVHIRITDTGKGITPEGQKLLFHKFQQAGDSILTRDDTKGTGLGLYISRLLATNMHGNVELESTEVGKGSTFTLTLPVSTAK